MKLHSKFFYSMNLLSKFKKNNYNQHQIRTSTVFINSQVLNSEDINIIESYFDSILRNVEMFTKSKTIFIFPNLFECLNFSIAIQDKIFQTKNKILLSIRKLTKSLKEKGIKIFHEIDLSNMLSYVKIINQYQDRSHEDYDYTFSSISDDILDLSKFLKTKNITINDSKDGQNIFKENVKKIADFYTNMLRADGLVFKNLIPFINAKKPIDIITNLKEVDYYLNEIKSLDLNLGLNLSLKHNTRIFKICKQSGIFKYFWVDDFNFKSLKNKNVISKLNYLKNLGYQSMLNNNINNLFFDEIKESSFNFTNVYSSYLLLNSILNYSLAFTWPIFSNQLNREQQEKLFRIFGTKIKIEQLNLPIEEEIVKIIKDIEQIVLELKFKIVDSIVVSNTPVFTKSNLYKFVIKVDNEIYEIIFNLSNNVYDFKFNINQVIKSNFQIINDQINSYQFIVKKIQ
ncbi:hypothetical protein [Mycoplasma crocodyli]|uniref:hypothetical protein n=1 Tax=Mycoplasma crocodyli TaxID=50052 RepID=UPI0005A2FD56|nr:hypothetical protein [Mycoplasma crocodyli]